MTKRGKVLESAISECERFLRVAKAYKPSGSYGGDAVGRAAAKRASLDATRALAQLRKAYAYDWDQDG